MALRKASAYSGRKITHYTRVGKKKSKSYIKTVPPSKIVKFKMGDAKGKENGRYPVVLNIVTKSNVQIRDNSIEAVRQFLNRFLTEKIGKEWFLEIKIYPHNILRENKMLTGAGADRMQTGMALSFGKTIGRAAVLKRGQTIFIVSIKNNIKQEQTVRKLINSVKSRLPCAIAILKEENLKT